MAKVFEVPSGLSWRPAYDRESVERFLAEAEAERTRLEAAIGDAKRRIAEAESELAAGGVDAAGVAASVATATEDLAVAKAEAERVVTEVLAHAETEAARILGAARDDLHALASGEI